ncbi:MAG: tRNA (adenosine(37)-N6)-threonylcarbamoyltransferase complex ATPase subunit type 1 TsaE [Proteobacteria bacterium]|nr:tRNA (adenosine(37)-N6)-threonylcarbamoyltransferase complex ATPase subunit type 1 TsaE [Pseudomonadota bacterium]
MSDVDDFIVCKRLLHSEADCALLAQSLASVYRQVMASQASSWKLYLQGDLGVGKTSFVRSLLRALGVAERIKSPSFALMHSYPLSTGNDAHHFDFYRLERPGDWLGVGLEASFDHPLDLVLVEWPEKALLPAWDLLLQWHWPEPSQARQLCLRARSDFDGQAALMAAFQDLA